MTRRPAVGLLGISGGQHDDELARHHEGFLTQVGRRLATVADIVSGVPVSSADALAEALTELERVGVDGVALVLLGEGPAPACAQLLADLDVPLLLANVQPERAIGDDWSAYDLRFNQGVGAAQALAGELVSGGVRFTALTGDWLSERFAAGFADWAWAARTRAAVAQAPDRELLECARSLLEGCASGGVRALDWNRDALLLAVPPDFAATPGPLTTAAFARVDGDELRLVVGSGELLAPVAPDQLQPLFAPDVGLEAFMDAWLELGAGAEFLIITGDRQQRWRHLADMLDIEYEEI